MDLALSIIIPARNVAETLRVQLDALAAQEWDSAWEVVVVDNRSTDETPAIVREYATRASGWSKRTAGVASATCATEVSRRLGRLQLRSATATTSSGRTGSRRWATR